MSLKLEWYDKVLDEHYIAGAIFDQFDAAEQKNTLVTLANSDKPIFVYFIRIEDMLVVQQFSDQEPEDEDYCFELDDELIELVLKYQDDELIANYMGVISLQFYEFEVLRDILDITEEDLEDLTDEEKEEILSIQLELRSMKPELLEVFLEKEIFFYSKEELDEFLLTHS